MNFEYILSSANKAIISVPNCNWFTFIPVEGKLYPSQKGISLLFTLKVNILGYILFCSPDI